MKNSLKISTFPIYDHQKPFIKQKHLMVLAPRKYKEFVFFNSISAKLPKIAYCYCTKQNGDYSRLWHFSRASTKVDYGIVTWRVNISYGSHSNFTSLLRNNLYKKQGNCNPMLTEIFYFEYMFQIINQVGKQEVGVAQMRFW